MYALWQANQLFYNFGGKTWESWHPGVRDYLSKTQQSDDHKEGSWNPGKADGEQTFGRVYSTSLGLLTLEVYFRYPLYRWQEDANTGK
jgi:hypothetical protein